LLHQGGVCLLKELVELPVEINCRAAFGLPNRNPHATSALTLPPSNERPCSTAEEKLAKGEYALLT